MGNGYSLFTRLLGGMVCCKKCVAKSLLASHKKHTGKREGKFSKHFNQGSWQHRETFFISPLNAVYRSFGNPGTSTFFLEAEKAEDIVLSDFRWNPK